MKKTAIFLLVAGLLAGGCSSKVLLPYEENPVCSKGQSFGYCGSLSDVYKHIENQEEENKWLEE